MNDAQFLRGLADVEPCEILIHPHASLRAVAEPVTDADLDEIRGRLPAMFSAIRKAPGIGLAATQAGIHKRFFIMDLAHEDEEPDPRVFINPEIIKESDEIAERQEGCLSLPGIYADVQRPALVTLRYQDLSGNVHTEEASEIKGACFQHETDHLDGILFVDYLGRARRDMLLRKLAKSLKRQA